MSNHDEIAISTGGAALLNVPEWRNPSSTLDIGRAYGTLGQPFASDILFH